MLSFGQAPGFSVCFSGVSPGPQESGWWDLALSQVSRCQSEAVLPGRGTARPPILGSSSQLSEGHVLAPRAPLCSGSGLGAQAVEPLSTKLSASSGAHSRASQHIFLTNAPACEMFEQVAHI